MDLSSKSRGSYFSPEFFKFLRGLARNNNRVWFQKKSNVMRDMSLHPASGSSKTLARSLEWLAHTSWRTLDPMAGHSSVSTVTFASPRTRVPTRPMWPWSSGTVEEERSPTPGYTFTWHRETVLPVQAYGILTPRPSTGSVGRSCPGPRLGDESRRVGCRSRVNP